VSAYPLVLEGSSLTALIVGAGPVALRKAAALLESGARVHVVAPRIDAAFAELQARSPSLHVTRAAYEERHLDAADLVIAATDDASLNARIAADARARRALVNVADAPELGNCITPAVHRAGELVVAVSAGGVPSAATRIRDAIGRVFDSRYSSALRELAQLRRSLLDAGRRDRWRDAAASLAGPDFCEEVESGQLPARIAEWR
jgi:siroheme synthase-like protein